MKKISQNLENKLIGYLDGTLDPAEKRSFEEQLDEPLMKRLRQLQDIDIALRHNAVEEPSKTFTQVVMSNLDQRPASERTFSIRGGIFLLAGVLVAAGFAAVLVSAGAFDRATLPIDLNQMDLAKRYIERALPIIPFNGKLMVNIIIVLNLGLAWLVLDRAILKPLFQRRLGQKKWSA